jgi:hypothetical protein
MEEINWTQDQMLEIGLKEPDDFLKFVKRYHELALLPVKKRNYISHVIFCISRVGISLYTSRSCLLLMVRTQT